MPESPAPAAAAERAAHGLTAAELLARRRYYGCLTAGELERWLLDERLAEPNGAPGRLVVTARGSQVAEAFTTIGG